MEKILGCLIRANKLSAAYDSPVEWKMLVTIIVTCKYLSVLLFQKLLELSFGMTLEEYEAKESESIYLFYLLYWFNLSLKF